MYNGRTVDRSKVFPRYINISSPSHKNAGKEKHLKQEGNIARKREKE
jgi:hypothetical protein